MDSPQLIHINVWVTSKEHHDLVRVKDGMTWREFILTLLKGGKTK